MNVTEKATPQTSRQTEDAVGPLSRIKRYLRVENLTPVGPFGLGVYCAERASKLSAYVEGQTFTVPVGSEQTVDGCNISVSQNQDGTFHIATWLRGLFYYSYNVNNSNQIISPPGLGSYQNACGGAVSYQFDGVSNGVAHFTVLLINNVQSEWILASFLFIGLSLMAAVAFWSNEQKEEGKDPEQNGSPED